MIVTLTLTLCVQTADSVELQTIERRLANVNYTQRRPNDNSYPHQAPTSAAAAVRLRHSRLHLFNEIDVPASATSAADDGTTAAAAASTSTSAARQPQASDRRGSSSLANRRRREVLADFRRRAALTLRQRMPVVRDVNKIDRFSRTAFPVLFVVFNVGYWVYYMLEKRTLMADKK